MRLQEFPSSLQIETTSRCNAKCVFCPHSEISRTQPQGSMDEALFLRLVDEMAEHPVSFVQPFLNNDPLMDRCIFERLRHLFRKLPLTRISITTNGVLLTPALADKLASLPLETIHISSNGLVADTCRDTMGIDGYRVLRNVAYLCDTLRRRSSRSRVVVTTILLRRNRDEIVHLRDYWKSRGVDFYLNPLNDRAGNLDTSDFEQMLPLAGDANRCQTGAVDMTGCATLYTFMAVLWNGDVVTCCQDWRRAHVMGNVRRDTLYDVWHGSRYRAMRALSDAGRLHRLPLCAGCGHNRFAIDATALKEHLRGLKTQESVRDSELLQVLETLHRESPQLIQMGLMR